MHSFSPLFSVALDHSENTCKKSQREVLLHHIHKVELSSDS